MRDRYIPDTRVHCCLFFINPTGHTLKPVSSLIHIQGTKAHLSQIDIVVLRKLTDVVNVVPVIAKSDSMTLEERAIFKERVGRRLV